MTRRRASTAFIGLALVLVAAGVALWLYPTRAEPVSAQGDPSPAVEVVAPADTGPDDTKLKVTSPDDTRQELTPAVRPPWRPGTPQQLRIPRLGVASQVVPVEAPGGALVPPSDPQVLGWWAQGAQAGARLGSTLLTGHTVHTGGGALDDLETLRRGDRITVRTDEGPLPYVVWKVAVFSKGTLAVEAPRIFNQDKDGGRLVVVTCEDWDGTRYLSNVVVTARPLL